MLSLDMAGEKVEELRRGDRDCDQQDGFLLAPLLPTSRGWMCVGVLAELRRLEY